MNENYVHVNSYVKHDGTEVKEHIRRKPDCDGINGCYPKPQSPMNVLQGGVEINDYIDNYPVNEKKGSGDNSGNILGAILSTAGFALNIGAEALNIVSKLQSPKQYYNSNEIRDLKTNLHTKISRLKETQKVSEKENEKRLERLINTTNQKDYTNLYNTFVQQRELNKKNNDVLKRIEYASKNDDYKILNSELLNFQSNYQDVVKKVSDTKPVKLNTQSNPTLANVSTPVPTPYINTYVQPNLSSEAKLPDMPQFDWEQIRRTGLHDYPGFEKFAINTWMDFKDVFSEINDTYEFWNASANHFKNSDRYIEKNGYFYNSINQLPEYLREYMRNKLYEQLGVTDSRGILLKPDSSLSKQISQSNEIAEFIKRNRMALLNGKIVDKGSLNFLSNENLHLSLGHADVLNAFIDSNGNLSAIIGDTYDFNKNDPSWKVEWAYNVQENGLIENYFVLCIISIPFLQWIRMLY